MLTRFFRRSSTSKRYYWRDTHILYHVTGLIFIPLSFVLGIWLGRYTATPLDLAIPCVLLPVIGFIVWSFCWEFASIKERDLQEHTKEADLEYTRRIHHLGLMATATTHELNQPIGIIRLIASGTLADIQDDLFAPDETPDVLRRILAQTDRMAAIVHQFRDFATGDRNEVSVFDLNSVVTQVAETFSPQLKHHDITFTLELVPEILWVKANHYQLEEIFINLISNARNAVDGQADAQISLTSHRSAASQVQVIVADNGPGLPDEYLPLKFTPFVSTKSSSQGTGLGLFIAHKIANQHSGTLIYQNAVEGGAVFILTLPLLADEEG